MSDAGDIPVSSFAAVTGEIFYLKMCLPYFIAITEEEKRVLDLWDRKVNEYEDADQPLIVPTGRNG
jgi:hypothetical protein